MKVNIEISLLDSNKVTEFSENIVTEFSLVSKEYIFIFNGKNYKWDLKKALSLIKNASNNYTFFLSSKNGPDGIIITTPATKFARKAISLTVDYSLFNQKIKILENLFVSFSDIFISCFVFDYRFSVKQNATYESDLNEFKEELKNVKFIKNKYGEKVIDNQKNVGKHFILNRSFLTAAPIMYFSENIKILNFEQLQEYTNGADVVYLKNNLIKIKLFDEIPDTEKAENIEKLKKFKEHFQFNKVAEKDEY
jgi:hypothetical protein